ncbi:DUF6049 family protein [Agrococcus beijingensis]|uniref:DUF6049 family protein n=1 Tax=Agrococcus beijingensis TaxID=3068634 RepID=UPI0027425912|nr:DUF6049 family protein [Agrococcus sp. REN33]
MLSAGRLARRRATACAAAAVATALLAAPLAGADRAQAAIAPASDGELSIAPVDPLLSEGERLVLQVTIDNASATASPATTVDVLLTTAPIATRYALTRWFDGQAIAANRSIATVELPEVAALEQETVTVTVEADALGLDGTPWGAYGIAASAPSMSGATSVVVRDEPGESSPTRLALAAPIDAPVEESGLLAADDLAAATGPRGLARTTLDAALAAGATVGVDPAFGASAAALGQEAPAAASAWLDAADTPSAYPLLYANADPIALVRAGLYPVEPLGIPIADGSPLAPSAGVVGSRRPVIDATSAVMNQDDLVALSGIGTVVLSTGNLDEQIGGRTPGAHIEVAGVEVLAADAEVQRAVGDAASADAVEASEARAELMALLATITRERPSDPRTLAAVLPATTQGASIETLADLASARFVDTVGIDAALEAESRPAELSPLEDPSRVEGAVFVQQALAHEQEVARVASIVADPSTLLAELRLSLLAALPDAGRRVTDADRAAIDGLGSAMTVLRNGVQIVGGSEIQAVGERVPMPITITNQLDEAAEVVLTVRASNALMTVREPSTTIVVPAGSQQRVQVPVDIVGTGTVLLIAQLHTPDGVPLGQIQTLRVSAQPTIEVAVAWVLGSAIVLLLGFGIWRSVRKRRLGKAHGDLDTPEEHREQGDPE